MRSREGYEVAGGDVDHSEVRSGRVVRRWSGGLVLLVLVLAVVSYSFDLGPRVLGWDRPSPVTAPAEVAPPPGLTLPSPSAAASVAQPEPDQAGDPAAVRRALAKLLHDKDLGPRVAVVVGQVSDGATVFKTGPSSITPASTMKLLTTTAALATLGPDHRFSTAAVAGASPRDVVLVGGGDPLLARTPRGDAYPPRADVTTLAKATARSLKQLGRTRVRLGYDNTLFAGPAVNPAWPSTYITENVVSPISALWVDEGRERLGLAARAGDPALAAATDFAQALEKQGIVVRGKPRPEAAKPAAQEYAAVHSAPLAQIVQWILEVSDNEGAEVLSRQVARAEGEPASFAGGAAAVKAVLTRLGVDTSGARILDGSGLSRDNRLAPGTLLGVLELAASDDHSDLRRVVTGLPVAGFTGSLTYRFDKGDAAGLGRVRAKTGTLTGVHVLAGLATDEDGTVFAFVAAADRVKPIHTLDARERLDEVAAALAACSCAAGPAS
ncbi:MAG TPA: D-alanyl-D-alanine carboxypeptidase/D-alanyl-D-alanine-endopeptidase [Nocardioidaceae bacterium]|nr:D-alanyl-D-alanine carboxypeptidase/D-alanyl-D-alanine-endopeptidase [Nocardioidaceae bacterium]